MKREDVKNRIPGITDEQLNWLMQENGADINREKTAAAQLQTQLEAANNELNTARSSLAKYDGVDVDALQGQVETLKFDNALDAAILGKKGRNVKAVRALLDLDALKGSENRAADIDAALETAAKANPWAFGSASGGYPNVDDGGEYGARGSGGQSDGVTAAFAKLNPNLKV